MDVTTLWFLLLITNGIYTGIMLVAIIVLWRAFKHSQAEQRMEWQRFVEHQQKRAIADIEQAKALEEMGEVLQEFIGELRGGRRNASDKKA